MDRSSEDALWRSIVENYGERADLDDHPDPSEATGAAVAEPDDPTATSSSSPAAPTTPAAPPVAPPVAPVPGDGADHDQARAEAAAGRGREFDEAHEVPDRFVPPVPPPLPYVAPARLGAWAALVGGPLLLVLSLVAGLPLSPFFKAVAALAFVGGFVYLVVSMPRDPREPWDDGAVV